MKKTVPLLIIVLVAVAVAIYFYISVNPNRTNVEAQTDFVIEDTSSIGKIFIADQSGRQIKLVRDQNTWTVNDKFKAREDGISTLLSTFKNVYIQRPVAKEKQSQVNKVMAAANTKVEIYDREGEWIKTWFVGHTTKDNKGTYVLLETPRFGKASKPFILDKKGFIGVLNTRFFTNLNEWRSTQVFKYPSMNLSEVEVRYPDSNAESFRIEYGGGNNIKVFPYESDQAVEHLDSSLIKDYMLNFKLASFENYKTGLSPSQEDSVVSMMPYQIIKVKDKTGSKLVKLWPMENPTDTTDGMMADPERIYATLNDGELALAQRYAWDKFRAPVQSFIKGE